MKASYTVRETSWERWCCYFYIDNRPNFDEFGTDGTGCKLYATKEKAEAAGKRYMKKMQSRGFDIH